MFVFHFHFEETVDNHQTSPHHHLPPALSVVVGSSLTLYCNAVADDCTVMKQYSSPQSSYMDVICTQSKVFL